MRAKWILGVLTLCCALSAIAGAPAAMAAQRIDMKVLLLGASGSEPSFFAWQSQLRREGVPFDQIVATPGHAPITEATLATTTPEGTPEARYEAVIVAVGNLPRCEEGGCASALAPEEWSALAAYEQTFHVRQLTAYAFPGAEEGLTGPTFGGPLDGSVTTLTSAGRRSFPYLNGSVPIGAGTWGYEATPLEAASFTTYLTDPNGASLLGVFVHPEGREELVQTFDGNGFQIHSQLLRHGELAWATRGVFFGDEHNYLEMQVDDIFLGDDIWNPTGHFTDFNPEDAVRMTPTDVAKEVEWSRAKGVRIDNVFNGGGSVAYAEEHEGSDPLLSAFQANKSQFGWINHTFTHPNLDCSTRNFIAWEILRNVRWAQAAGFAVNGKELVTGEHSGLANMIPGNPGMIDPPSLGETTVFERGGTLAPGSYDYAVTALSPTGETVGATTTETATVARSSIKLTWEAICHATGYRIYRRVSPEGAWSLAGSVTQPLQAFKDTGPAVVSFQDRGASSTGAPPSFSTATLAPYAQNPNFINALRDASVKYIASDTSKPYPQDPLNVNGPVWPAGTSFVDGPARAIPRYPTNVYYNTATRQQQLDEYNYLYLPPWLGGGCVESPTNTCRTSAATWEDYVEAESQRIFGLMMGNDPRPHYFHQTNLAESDNPEGAVFYPVMEAVLADYARYFNSTMPIKQYSPTQIGELIARQDTWAASSGVTGYIEGTAVTIVNGSGAAIEVPLSGTELGSVYGGTRSGWTSAPVGTSSHHTTVAWPPATPAPPPAPLAAGLATTVKAVKHAAGARSAGEPVPLAGAVGSEEGSAEPA